LDVVLAIHNYEHQKHIELLNASFNSSACPIFDVGGSQFKSSTDDGAPHGVGGSPSFGPF
jgi:hypothetical protein